MECELNYQPETVAKYVESLNHAKRYMDHCDTPTLFRFDHINSIRSPGQAALRETGDQIERETRFLICAF